MVSLEPRTGKWLAIALTASLGVNIFLAGLFVGRQMVEPPALRTVAFRPGDRPMPAFVDRVAAALTPDHRDTFLTAMGKFRPQIEASGDAVREARMKVRQLLAAEKFDRAATEQAMAELRQRNTEYQRTVQAALLGAAEALPPDARRAMLHPEQRQAIRN
jgi:uncharacterized membrane protein